MRNSAGKLIKAMNRRPESAARHVFVVDDDSAVRKSIKFVLELEGFEMRAYSSTQQLLVEESMPFPSCLVVDYHLPGMNGLELVAKLRERNYRSHYRPQRQFVQPGRGFRHTHG